MSFKVAVIVPQSVKKSNLRVAVGKLMATYAMNVPIAIHATTCPSCHGNGGGTDWLCKTCDGTGIFRYPYNPRGKWDFYLIDGYWRDTNDINDDLCYLAGEITDEVADSFCAVIDPRGGWHDGTRDTPDSPLAFVNILHTFGLYTVVVVECHVVEPD